MQGGWRTRWREGGRGKEKPDGRRAGEREQAHLISLGERVEVLVLYLCHLQGVSSFELNFQSWIIWIAMDFRPSNINVSHTHKLQDILCKDVFDAKTSRLRPHGLLRSWGHKNRAERRRGPSSQIRQPGCACCKIRSMCSAK